MPFPQTGPLTRVSYPLPPRRRRLRSGILRVPQRHWPRHRKFVRSHHCVVPGCQALESQCCHIRTAANAGSGLKPHDGYTFPACAEHHAEQHRIGQDSFQSLYGLDLFAIAAELVRKSPDWKMRLAIELAGIDPVEAA